MTTVDEKTIHEYQCCAKRQRRQNFRGYMWPTISRNYKFYSLIDNQLTFQTQDTLYSFEDSTTCSTLRRYDYLLKLANAVAYFGERHIIRPLNDYCEQNINESATATQLAYRAPRFEQWKDVTNYVGNRDSQRIPAWEREKKQTVYNQIRIIAEQNEIPAQNWNTLISLYHDRNMICHKAANIADTESIKTYEEPTNDPMERESVRILSELVIKALQPRRRGWR